MPGTRPSAKKRTVVETVDADFSELLGQTTSADVLDKCGIVREHVVGGVVGALAHVPAKTEALLLDPDVGDSFEGTGVLGSGRLAGGRRIG